MRGRRIGKKAGQGRARDDGKGQGKGPPPRNAEFLSQLDPEDLDDYPYFFENVKVYDWEGWATYAYQ